MAVYLSPIGGAGAQFFDDNGKPLSGGKLYTYVAGTSTPKTTYTTSAGSIAHANPIVLDAAGRVSGSGEIWLTAQSYKFVLMDANDVTVATYDNIIGQNISSMTPQNFTGDGAMVAFTLTSAPNGENATNVYINGVYQFKNTYSLSGTTLTFSEAPPDTSKIEVMYN